MSDTTTYERPSATGAFFKGLGSGLLSGLLMSGIVVGLMMIPGIGPAGLTFAKALMTYPPLLTLASGLFGGVMAVVNNRPPTLSAAEYSARQKVVKRDYDDLSQTIFISQVASPDQAEQPQPNKNWVESTGRSGDAQSRIQAILNNGAMSDKSRASAILAEREAAAGALAERG